MEMQIKTDFWELIQVLVEYLPMSMSQKTASGGSFYFSEWRKGVLWRNWVIPGEEWGSRQLFQVCRGASTHLDALGGRICLQQWNMLWEWCLHWTESRWRAYFLQDAKNESKRSLSKDGMQFITKCKTVCSSIAHWWARDLYFVDWKGERGVLLSKYL